MISQWRIKTMQNQNMLILPCTLKLSCTQYKCCLLLSHLPTQMWPYCWTQGRTRNPKGRIWQRSRELVSFSSSCSVQMAGAAPLATPIIFSIWFVNGLLQTRQWEAPKYLRIFNEIHKDLPDKYPQTWNCCLMLSFFSLMSWSETNPQTLD